MTVPSRIRLLEAASEFDAATLPADPSAFLRRLEGPTLIRQAGADRTRTRIVSTLLHANEPSGLSAVLRWLRDARQPATDALFFVASVEAALDGNGFQHRFRPGHTDMNRCWLPPFAGREGAIASEALGWMRAARAECLVDLHNNTGHNPPYGVGPAFGPSELNLVGFFSHRFIHSTIRLGTLVEATHNDFPSVTIECGRSFDPSADEVAYAGLGRLLEAPRLDSGRPGAAPRVMVDPVRVCVRPGIGLEFGDGPSASADLTVSLDIDRHNFERMRPGTPIGWLREGSAWPIEAVGASGRDVSSDHFEVRDGRLVARKSLVPVMMTTHRENALADCLFYIVRDRDAPASDGG